MTAPIVHITDKEHDLQAQLDHSRACVQQMSRLNEAMVAELAEARVEIERLKAQPVQPAPLTMAQIDVVRESIRGTDYDIYAFARAIEAALRTGGAG